jgi:hypothetical protein
MWKPVFGDPSTMGWLITMSYLALVLLIAVLLLKLYRMKAQQGRLLLQFWLFAFVFYLLLGLNKQLDLQTFITATGRCVARVEGWYNQRRGLQTSLVFIGIGIAAVVLLALLHRFFAIFLKCWPAVLGIGLSTIFVLLRLISFHHVDQILSMRVFDFKLHALIEFSGIASVFLNAAWLLLAYGGSPSRRY